MEIQGTIAQVLPLQSGVGKGSGKEWKKQDYILETNEQYPKKICFTLWGDNVAKFNLQQGEQVTVQVDLESREYNGRWYTEVRAWRVDRGAVSPQAVAQPPQAQQYTQPSSVQGYTTSQGYAQQGGADDLPF